MSGKPEGPPDADAAPGNEAAEPGSAEASGTEFGSEKSGEAQVGGINISGTEPPSEPDVLPTGGPQRQREDETHAGPAEFLFLESTPSEPTPPRQQGPRRGGLLPGFSLKRPVTVIMMFVALLVLGAIAYTSIPLELLPGGFTPPYFWVQVPTLPSTPEDIEERIAIPLEEMLSTVRNLEDLSTRINADGVTFVMELADGTDMDVAYNQVQDRMDRVLGDMDDEVAQYFIWKYNPADDPVSWLGVSVPEGVDVTEDMIERVLVPRIERIAGVSRVELHGVPDRVVTIEIDDRLAEAAGPGTFDLVQRMMRDNFTLAGGTIRASGERYPLRVVARYESLEEIRSLPVGNGLTLSDIGSVYIEDRDERSLYRVNERPGIFMAVYKESTANTVDVGRAVREALGNVGEDDPRLAGVEFHFFFEQSEVIEGALGNLQQTAMWGGLFAIIVLVVFLRRAVMTLIITLAIPVSLLCTVVVMYFTGFSLNVLSLTGLMLSVGLVVDNSIVVVESIQRKQLEGMNARDAAWYGTADVALAILVATMTTVVVFLPMILMGGDQTLSFYLGQIGLPVCVSLISSLGVSLVFIPLASLRGLGSQPPRLRMLERVENAYRNVLAWVLRRRADATFIAAAAFISMFVIAPQVPRTDQADANINDFRIYVEYSPSIGWDERVEHLMLCESYFWGAAEELFVKDLIVRMGGQWGRPQLRAFLMDPSDRELDRDEIIERALALMPERPGIEYTASWDNPTGPAQAVTIDIVGPDTRRLGSLADELGRRLQTLDGVTAVISRSQDDTEFEVHYEVDSDRADRVGLNAFIVGTTLDYAMRGRQLQDFRTDSMELPMYIQGNTAESDEVEEVANLEMPGPFPGVTLGSVADATIERGFTSINRTNRRTLVTLEIQASRDDLDVLGEEIDAVANAMTLPIGYSIEKGRRFSELQKGAQERTFAITLAIVFVFLLMGVLFESFVLPFSIVLSIPFAFAGVYWALFLTNTSFDMMAGVGLIILIGIVVNNAIVLVDRVSELRRAGMPRTEAILEAGHQRMRPIVMTALTTIFGIVPMAVGDSALVGIPYAPMGRAVIGGLVASTLLTLFVVPLFYTFFDDMAQSGARNARRFARRMS